MAEAAGGQEGARVQARAGLRSRTARLVAAGVLVYLGGWLLWLSCGLRGCPDVDVLASWRPGGAPELLDRHGEPFARLTPVEHILVPLDSIPEHVVEAFIAVEDRRFREHDGVDRWRVLGALRANLKARAPSEGFSTITMQLARNVFPDRLPAGERSLGRKLLEVRVAGAIEDRFSKDEILELYLNHIWFGRGARGIAEAAWLWFGRPVTRLDPARGALLAALPRAPTHYDPLEAPEAARERRDLVLTLMEEQGRIAPERASAARSQGLGIAGRSAPLFVARPTAPWLAELVRRTLEERLGEELYARPLRVRTTLDPEVQAILEDEMERQLRLVEGGAHGRFRHPRYRAGEAPPAGGTPYLQGAAVVLDAVSGDVLGLVGGRDERHSGFDRATRARRPLGSAFKPFVAATALERGRTPLTLLADSPLSLATRDGKVYRPTNFDGEFEGPVTLREALVRSRNVPVVRLADEVGLERVLRLARRLGLGEDAEPRLSLALGALETSPLELAAAYTAFAAEGRRAEPRLVLSIEDPEGRTLWKGAPRGEQVLSPEVAFLVTDMLEEAVERGTGRAVLGRGYRGPVAGKTGTSDQARDAWFVGYTPDLVGVVWMGFDRPAPILEDASGGALAAPVLGGLLSRVHRGRDLPGGWEPPAGVVELAVDRDAGTAPGAGCAGTMGGREWFIRGSEPRASCPEEGGPGLLARAIEEVDDLLERGGAALLELLSPSPAPASAGSGADRRP